MVTPAASALKRWRNLGFSEKTVESLVRLEELKLAPDVIHLKEKADLTVDQTRQLISRVSEELQFDWLRNALVRYEPANEWKLTQQELLLRQTDGIKRKLLRTVLEALPSNKFLRLTSERIRILLHERMEGPLKRYHQTIRQLKKQHPRLDLTMLAVAVHRLETLSKSSI